MKKNPSKTFLKKIDSAVELLRGEGFLVSGDYSPKTDDEKKIHKYLTRFGCQFQRRVSDDTLLAKLPNWPEFSHAWSVFERLKIAEKDAAQLGCVLVPKGALP